MFITKKTHERLLKQAVENAEANERQIADALASVREDTIKRLRQNVADREARITAMTPDFELGRKRRLNYEADNARRKAKREAAKKPRTASETVSAIGKQTEALNKSLKEVQAKIKAIS